MKNFKFVFQPTKKVYAAGAEVMRSLRRRQSGVALIMVLSVVALLVLLVTGFLSMVHTETRSSGSYAKGEEAKLLADLPLNIVIAQVRKATENNGSTKTWASQPGLIRVFGQNVDPLTQRTKLDRAYKLYSAAEMEVLPNEGGMSPDINPTNELPEQWHEKKAMFTDLNAPVYTARDSSGKGIKPVYPIVDPEGFNSIPVGAGGQSRIAGAELLTSGSGLEKLSVAPATENNPSNPLPMPVRWIYILQDGAMSAGSASGGDGMTVSVPGATVNNPVAGRIAFWTDDESSKVNINTASEGAFWDLPLGNTNIERGNAAALNNVATAPFGYATSLLVRDEFTRYPGHPSRTSLSAIFGPWMPMTKSPHIVSEAAEYATQLEAYYKLAPRVAMGGTRGGTVITTSGTSGGTNPRDPDRYYASTDELIFNPARTNVGVAAINADVLSKTRFFLTAHSRAPEVNLFNKPRISIWPISFNTAHRNAVDSVIAFASTANKRPFYFQRASSTTTGSQLTSAHYLNKDYTDSTMTRNRSIMGYLQQMTQANIPGFGGNFAQKYTDDADQILTETLDYVRSAPNVVSKSIEPKYYYAGSGGDAGENYVVPLRINLNDKACKGFGRFPTITEAALVFTGTEKDAQNRVTKVECFLILNFLRLAPGEPQLSPRYRVKITGMDGFKLGPVLTSASAAPMLPMGFLPSATTRLSTNSTAGGWGPCQAYQNLLVFMMNGLNTFKNVKKTNINESNDYPFFSDPVAVPLGDDPSKMTFTGAPITIEMRTVTDSPESGGELIQKLSMDFSGTQIFPRPHMDDAAIDAPNPSTDKSAAALEGGERRTFAQRIKRLSDNSDYNYPSAPSGKWGNPLYTSMAYWKDHRLTLINKEDVVRAIQLDPAGPSKGDFRLLAATTEVPASWFKKNSKWSSTDYGDRDGCSLREDRWNLLGQVGYNPQGNTTENDIALVGNNSVRPTNISRAGPLVAGLKYGPSAVPIVPKGTTAALNADNRPGDWETGVGIFSDGPFLRYPILASYKYNGGGYYSYGYDNSEDTGTNFTPNRQISSPVMFGALPTGVKNLRPWQTLLFCPNPASRQTVSTSLPTTADHFGFGSPKDHLYLDWFWMPVAQPGAISEPFSTGGKINMNTEIYPFRYIKRRTGLHAALKNTRITALPPDLAADKTLGNSDNYKGLNKSPYDFRYDINLDSNTGTLRGLELRFQSGDVFRSASEICDIFLVPATLKGAVYHPNAPVVPTYASSVLWWRKMTLTGDNGRESPYNDIYPRLTTKSNVFQVHYKVQYLRKARSTDPTVWDEEKDSVSAEQRGSSIFERYIDPGDRNMPDMASTSDFANPAFSLDRYYRHRVVQTRQFAP
ncbi:MAG: Verru_Chthon cassette protein A [Verrucomicrobium sp.]|nr:Verru_Chthon cassette protein A [Verrucomicrobium sp.]